MLCLSFLHGQISHQLNNVITQPISSLFITHHPIIHKACLFRNLPFGGRATRGSWVRLPWEEDARSHHQRLFEENVKKKRKRYGLRTLSVKGSGVVFMHGEGISTPRVHHKGQQPLIKCTNMTSKCFIFLFFMFFCVFMIFMFFCIFYLFVVDKGVSLTPTYPQLRLGNQTYVVLCELNVG